MSIINVTVNSNGNINIEELGINQIIDRSNKELNNIAKRQKIVEQKTGSKMSPIFAPEVDSNEKLFAIVPNCPSCGNNDSRGDELGSLITLQRYSTSGYDMECLACGTKNWRFWVPQMDPFGCVTFNGSREYQNAKKIPTDWKP